MRYLLIKCVACTVCAVGHVLNLIYTVGRIDCCLNNSTSADDTSPVKKEKTSSMSVVDESGWKLFKNPGRWFYNQCCGWKADSDGKYHGIWNRLQHAEFKKLFSGDNLDIEEVESALSTIAFVSMLILLLLISLRW